MKREYIQYINHTQSDEIRELYNLMLNVTGSVKWRANQAHRVVRNVVLCIAIRLCICKATAIYRTEISSLHTNKMEAMCTWFIINR